MAKTNRLILMAALLAVVLGVLSWLQSGQEETKQAVISELEVVSQRESKLNLDGLSERIEGLKQTEIQAVANATAIKEYFVSRSSDLDVAETLYPIARECRVNLRLFGSPGVRVNAVEGVVSADLRLTLEVHGEVTDVLDFIGRVHETYPTGHLITVTVANPPGLVHAATDVDYTTGAIYQASRATLTLLIQNYMLSDDSG